MPSTTTRGAFIVIEGLDKSGKSTQAARLLDRIQSSTTDVPTPQPPPKAVLLKFPGEFIPPLCRIPFDAPLYCPRTPPPSHPVYPLSHSRRRDHDHI